MPKSDSPLADLPLVAFDTETTGASAAMGHRIIELGMVRYEAGRVVDSFSQLFDPGRPLSPTITLITGITSPMLAGQPRFADCLPRILQMMRGAVLVGHNVAFDLSFLDREFRILGMTIEGVFGESIVLDTLRLARQRFGRGGNSLPILAGRLGVQVKVSHRALADAQTTAGVLERLLEAGWETPLGRLCEAQGGQVPLPSRSSESPLPLELQEAIELAVPVVMEYVDAQSKLSCRTIEPRYIRRRRGEMCLVAFCHLRNAERTFRIDRIVRLSRAGAPPHDIACPPHDVACLPHGVVRSEQETAAWESSPASLAAALAAKGAEELPVATPGDQAIPSAGAMPGGTSLLEVPPDAATQRS